MKKMFLLATLALSCVFASCSKDDDDDTKTEKNQVAFGTKIGNPIELTPADSNRSIRGVPRLRRALLVCIGCLLKESKISVLPLWPIVPSIVLF
jgi:hypothetical protein